MNALVLGADRIAFRKWAMARGFRLLRQKSGERLYLEPVTETAWQAWKAACEWKSGGLVDDEPCPETSIPSRGEEESIDAPT
mgnify:CR=1 FL=1